MHVWAICFVRPLETNVTLILSTFRSLLPETEGSMKMPLLLDACFRWLRQMYYETGLWCVVCEIEHTPLCCLRVSGFLTLSMLEVNFLMAGKYE